MATNGCILGTAVRLELVANGAHSQLALGWRGLAERLRRRRTRKQKRQPDQQAKGGHAR